MRSDNNDAVAKTPTRLPLDAQSELRAPILTACLHQLHQKICSSEEPATEPSAVRFLPEPAEQSYACIRHVLHLCIGLAVTTTSSYNRRRPSIGSLSIRLIHYAAAIQPPHSSRPALRTPQLALCTPQLAPPALHRARQYVLYLEPR